MKLKSLILALSVASSGVAIADSYRGEVGINASRINSEFFDSDSKYYGLTGAYYFSPVKTDAVPLAEAAYLGQNSNIFGQYINVPSQHSFPKTEGYVAGAEIYIPESFLYVRGGASHYKIDAPHNNNNDWFVSVGVTPIKGLLVTTSYSDDAGYNPNIRAKYVTDIGSGHFINVEAEVADIDHLGTTSILGGDFYFDETFSLGGEIQHAKNNNFYELRARKFFTQAVSGGIALEDGENENAVTVDVSFRF